jgi:hypothetical protein
MRGFAGTVLPHEAVDIPFVETEVDSVEGADARVHLCDVAELEQSFFHDTEQITGNRR